MNIALYALGFLLLLAAIFMILIGIAGKCVPRFEPELLVVDDPLPGDGLPAIEGDMATEMRA